MIKSQVEPGTSLDHLMTLERVRAAALASRRALRSQPSFSHASQKRSLAKNLLRSVAKRQRP